MGYLPCTLVHLHVPWSTSMYPVLHPVLERARGVGPGCQGCGPGLPGWSGLMACPAPPPGYCHPADGTPPRERYIPAWMGTPTKLSVREQGVFPQKEYIRCVTYGLSEQNR